MGPSEGGDGPNKNTATKPQGITNLMGNPQATQSLDRAFDVLSHTYRRQILLLVSERTRRDEDEFSVADLETADDEEERTRLELYHAHLPKLAEAGYIEWEADTHTIQRGPNFDETAPLLRVLADHEDQLPEGWP